MTVESAWSPDEIVVDLFQDHIGLDIYRLTTPSGISSFVSSAHLVEERKIQLHRLYGAVSAGSSELDLKELADQLVKAYVNGFLRDFRSNEGLSNVLSCLLSTVFDGAAQAPVLTALVGHLDAMTPPKERNTKVSSSNAHDSERL